jgi:hypothetical protein
MQQHFPVELVRSLPIKEKETDDLLYYTLQRRNSTYKRITIVNKLFFRIRSCKLTSMQREEHLKKTGCDSA